MRASRKALLALDLAGIERGTREQVVELGWRDIGVLANIARSGSAADEPAARFAAARTLRWNSNGRTCSRTEAKRELEFCKPALCSRRYWRGRGAKLRVLANMLAGPSVNYGPPCAARNVAPAPRLSLASGGRDLSHVEPECQPGDRLERIDCRTRRARR